MGFVSIFGIGIGLSMDAFAAALCKGLCMKQLRLRYAFLVALFFGGFQGLMPIFGWLLASQFERQIERYDHWIAFVFLLFIGGKMLWDAIRGENDTCKTCTPKPKVRELLVLAVATSIDAMATGIFFAPMQVNIWYAASVIAATTFVLSFIGVLIGNRFGTRYQRKAAVAGGLILIFIGVKILTEHLLG